MSGQKITKRIVDAISPNGREYVLWDSVVTGLGVRVRPSGTKTYIVVYRAGSGRGAPVRRFTIAATGKIAPEVARSRARAILGSVVHGHDPAQQKTTERQTLSVAELADQFMTDHVKAKCKGGTAKFYQEILDRIIKPAFGDLTWLF